jgi:hypothetical protein
MQRICAEYCNIPYWVGRSGFSALTSEVTTMPLLAPLVAALPSKVVPEGLFPTAALEQEGRR